MIGRNVNDPIVLQGGMNGVQEVWCYNSAPLMAPLRPWVGKQEIECFHRFSGQQITHRVGTLHLQKPHIIQTGGFTRRAVNPTRQSFDPEKVFVRQALRQRAKKRTVAAAKIDMQGGFASEDLFRIEPIRQRLGRLCDQPRTDVPAVS